MTRPQPPHPPSHGMYTYETWVEDGMLYITVIPDAWWNVDEEAWRRLAHRKARKLVDEVGYVIRPDGLDSRGRIRMHEVERVLDYAMVDRAVQMTFAVPIEQEAKVA